MKQTLSKFLRVFRVAMIGVVVLSVSYGAGTFNPNIYTVAKIENETERYYNNWAASLGLNEPSFEYNNDVQFVKALNKCIDFVNFTTDKHQRVPIEMIVGQAALESGWGTSRFALEANNLFGIRTYKKSEPHLLPLSMKKWKGWGVKKFETKCDSVKYFVNLLNNHHAYEEFRKVRKDMLRKNQPLDATVLIKTLDKYSTTENYAELVISIIEKTRKLETVTASSITVEK